MLWLKTARKKKEENETNESKEEVKRVVAQAMRIAARATCLEFYDKRLVVQR